jgi:hypothetical protein
VFVYSLTVIIVIIFSTYKETYEPPTSSTKALKPYKANSLRSIPPVKFDKAPQPHVRHCAPRNIHQFDIKYGRSSDVDRTRFSTTYRNNYVEHDVQAVGFNNSGIVSTKTQWIKKRLSD